MSFEQFDGFIQLDSLKENIDEAVKDIEANNFDEVPKGEYIVKIEGMELKQTQDGRPMFSIMCRIVEAVMNKDAEKDNEHAIKYLSHFKDKKPCVFMNKVIYGTKNDAKMIANVLSFLNKLQAEQEAFFNCYSDFERVIYEIFAEVEKTREYHIAYDKDAFNTIKIKECFAV